MHTDLEVMPSAHRRRHSQRSVSKRAFSSRRSTGLVAIAVGLLLGLLATLLTSGGASAAPLSITPLHYKAAGTLLLPTISGTGTVGPGTFDGQIVGTVGGSTSVLTGTIRQPDIKEVGTLLGVIPVVVTSSFTQIDGGAGTVNASGAVSFDITANIVIKSILVGGVSLTSATCHPVNATKIHFASVAGSTFSVAGGVTLASDFSLGSLADCGLATSVLNLFLPSANHHLTLAFTA